MVKRIGGSYREADKMAAIEMYLSGPETMANVASTAGNVEKQPEPVLQVYRAHGTRRIPR